MRVPHAACLAVVLGASAGLAAPPALDIPADQLRPVNGFIAMVPTGDAKSVTYIGLNGAEPTPAAFLSDKRLFLLPVKGLTGGVYRFAAVGSRDDEHTTREFSITLGDPPAPPRPPGPGPQPDADPLVRALKAAVAADPAAERPGASKLADLYAFAADRVAAGDGTVYAVTTARELMAATGAKAADLGVAGTLKGTQGVAAAEIRKAVPADLDAKLTAQNRADAERVFTRLAAAVKEATK